MEELDVKPIDTDVWKFLGEWIKNPYQLDMDSNFEYSRDVYGNKCSIALSTNRQRKYDKQLRTSDMKRFSWMLG